MSNLTHVTDANFEAEVIKSEIPVLVDFWAEWCGPCRMIGPVLEDLANNEYAGKVKIVKLNVDENTVSAATYGVRGIPTLLLFKNGEIIGTKVGALPKGQIAAFIDSAI
ncbi:MAG: thioredoxin TrxA [Neisseriaceae bacterium]|jgi:thioredoxin 1|nr:MAG: thioredoxin TrxA [Neisseriaceae bacterium]